MCAQFALKTQTNDLSLEYKIKISDLLTHIDSRFLPQSVAPVIVLSQSERKLTPMRFSLIPHWSKTSQIKFATHNARIETITQKPTWKLPFKSQHCLIPLTSFFESVYEGPLAGNIIRFTEPNEVLLFAAGIFDFWKDTNNPINNFCSFSILTQEPSKFILDHGHDRTPIFLKKEVAFDWLSLINQNEVLIKDELIKMSYHPALKVDIDRPLKSGWQTRI